MHCLLFLLLPFVLEFGFVCSDIPLSLLSCVWVQVLQEDTGLISSPLLKQGQVEPLMIRVRVRVMVRVTIRVRVRVTQPQ
jgi:hypothetical protein